MFDFRKYLGKEVTTSSFIPYSSHVTQNVLRLANGEVMQVIKLQGAAHESADIEDINIWHDQLNGLIRNISSPNVAIWTHVVRREYNEYPAGEFSQKFCREFNDKYRDGMANDRMLINELYIAFIYRPQPVKAMNLLKVLKKRTTAEEEEDLKDSIEALNDIVGAAMAGLNRYEPEFLGCYEQNGIIYSEVVEFLAYLINGEWHKFPLLRADISSVLAVSRPFFDKGGLITIKAPAMKRLAAILVIQEYPSTTKPGALDDLLSLPFEMVLTQSFTCLSKSVSVGRMQRQQQRMINAGDVAKSQIEEIDQALDDLVSNRFVMGAHHMTLLIYAETQKGS